MFFHDEYVHTEGNLSGGMFKYRLLLVGYYSAAHGPCQSVAGLCLRDSQIPDVGQA